MELVLILEDKSTGAWAERQIGKNQATTGIKTHLFMLLNVYVSRDQPVTLPPSGLIESAITRRRQKALEMTGLIVIDRFQLMHLTGRKPAGSEPRRGNVGISQRCPRCARKRFTDYLTASAYAKGYGGQEDRRDRKAGPPISTEGNEGNPASPRLCRAGR